MEGKPPRSGNRRRRDRAARMQKRQQQRHLAVVDMSEAEESPPARQKRPPTRKKRIKEPVFQEDIVDGFAFLCFKTYEDLQRTCTKYDKKAPEEGSTEDTRNPSQDHPPVLEESAPKLDKKPKTKKNNTLPKVKKKNNFLNHKSHNNLKDSCLTNDENSRPGDEILETPRGTSRDQLSDASSHASLERGYMCDSESGDERGSEPECDLFNSKITDSNFIAKKNNPGHSQTSTCRSPPLLPPILQHHHPVLANGTSNHHHHPEPSTAVAAVSASPANTPSAAGSASPREPQVGSPAVLRAACSPPSGALPASPPSFLPQKEAAAAAPSAAGGGAGKLLSNGYEFVSDTSPPSPAKLSSPSKYLHHKRPHVPSTAANKPASINVYDFVSDHSAPSSPDGVIFISQSKFHHGKGAEGGGKDPADASSAPSKSSSVSNGHLCPSPPVLSAAAAAPPPVKSALDMSIKPSKAEPPPPPPVILPPSAEPPQQSHHHPHLSPQPSRSSSHHYNHHSPARQQPSQYSPQQQRSSQQPPYSSSIPYSTSQRKPSSPAPSASRAASRGNTHSPAARDTHSAHSNSSSLSSLSQLSKEGGGGSRSHSNSSNLVVPLTSATTPYGATSSLTGLVFSKPQSWSGTCSTTNTLSVSSSRSTPPRGSPATLGGSLLPPAHHSSPFGSGLLPPAHLFPPGPSLASPLDAPGGPPASYRAPETLFSSHGEFKKHPDYLRRELDTRFLASQDHSIPIPPPPYMQSEVQHHSQMHQQALFPAGAPPSLGGPMVSQSASHLYEKYPKLDSSLYRRPSIGLSSYPPVSSLFTSSGGASTPFVPPAHLAALQPKINSVPKAKSTKPGKWCAMHVRIAWEIYNHQQKQKQAEVHKAMVKPPPAEHLHPATNHLFCSLPRTHELSPFSSSLLSASAHPRSYEAPPHHSTFLNPTPAHLGPFSRPGYPNFAGAGPGFSGLGPLGIAGPSMLTAGDLRLPPSQDHPWVGQSRGLGPFGGGSAWGGLKEEAERDRLQQQERKREEERKRAEQERREKEERERREQERREQERREQERRELERQEQERKEQERKEKERREMERRKELERREMERREHERREQERQKERDREIRLHHQLHKTSLLMNGDHPHLRDPHHPHLHPHHPSHHHPHHPHMPRDSWDPHRGRSPVVKYEHPSPSSPYGAVKIKQERKDDDISPGGTPEKQLQRKEQQPAALWDPYRGMAARYDPASAKLLPPPPQLSRAAAEGGFFSPPVSPYLCAAPSAASRAAAGKPGVLNGLPPPLIPCSFPNFVGAAAAAGRAAQEHKLVSMDPTAAYFAAAAAAAAKDRREQVNGGGPPHTAEFDLRL